MADDDDSIPGLYFERQKDGRLKLIGLELDPGETAKLWACARLRSFPLGPPPGAAVTKCGRCGVNIIYHPGAFNGPSDAMKVCMSCAGIEPQVN